MPLERWTCQIPGPVARPKRPSQKNFEGLSATARALESRPPPGGGEKSRSGERLLLLATSRAASHPDLRRRLWLHLN